MAALHPVQQRSGEHVVQFFDDAESRTAGLAAFVDEGLRQSDTVMVVVRDATRHRLVEMLGRVQVDEGERGGRLILLDAHATLARLLRRGLPDPLLFDHVVTPAIEGLGARRRVYGEMVDILAEEGNFAAVDALETLWTGLGTRLPFTLLCGYASAHFAAPGTRSLMRRVCHLHTRVERGEHDLLANWLLETHVAN